MATIAENLQTIKDSTAAIKQSIINKGGEIRGNITTWASAIDNIETGGGGGEVTTLEEKDVNFYDYDGTLLFSYTKEEFLDIDELPALPTQDGLICQGWNWSYGDAIAYVGEYGMLNIGATYITDDGRTRLYIRIAAEGRMDVPLYFYQSVSDGVVIDWGDNSPTETLSGTGNVSGTHTYAQTGDYVISLRVASGTLQLGHSLNNACVLGSTAAKGYTNMLIKVEIGSGVTSITNYTFRYCYSIKLIVIPNGVTSIGYNAFQDCHHIVSIVIPNGIKSIVADVFYSCSSLTSISIPNSVKIIGKTAFLSCYSLTSVVIPNSVTSIGANAFQDCKTLSLIVVPNSVNNLDKGIFYGCISLASIAIPNSVKSIGTHVFYNCISLASIVIPHEIISISDNAFDSCSSLASIVIPYSVNSIGARAFNKCSSIAFYDFTSHTSVPTLSNTDAFTEIASDCEIRVPAALVNGWKAATNWSTYADKIVGY